MRRKENLLHNCAEEFLKGFHLIKKQVPESERNRERSNRDKNKGRIHGTNYKFIRNIKVREKSVNAWMATVCSRAFLPDL